MSLDEHKMSEEKKIKHFLKFNNTLQMLLEKNFFIFKTTHLS